MCATGVASLSNCQKLPLGLTEPMLASSKRDLVKAKSISNLGSISVIIHLRRGMEKPAQLQPERGVRIQETTLQTQRPVKKEEEMLQVQSRDSPATCREDHGEVCCHPAAHGGL